jgi:Zn-dependent peptidase ImmA (M78 family)/transcriptional regulator with XRE-family HTH domain
MPSKLASPEPPALKWAREAAGYEPEAVANRLKINSDRLVAWETGEEAPTFTQLRNLAKVYKRPTAIFYLRELPSEATKPTDFRTQTNARPSRNTYSVELLHELRRARDRREWTIEMLSDLGRTARTAELAITIKTPAETAAGAIRNILGIDVSIQRSWRDDCSAFAGWRARVERIGVLCFQSRKLTVEECRGFSIAERPLPVIVTNIKESPRGRIFTLLHELVHVFLRDGGICDLRDGVSTEWYCNQVAGATIYPKAELLATEAVSRHPRGKHAWDDDELIQISRIFGGSREAALVRLLTLGLTSQDFYESKRRELIGAYKKINQADDSFVPPHTVELSCAGGLFTSTVLESLERRNITTADAAEYLHIGFKHLPDADKVAARYEGGFDE